MKATQTNAEESERDTERGNVSQLSYLQNVRVRTVVPRPTKAAFYASLLFSSDSEAARSAPRQLGSRAGLSQSAGVQPGGQPTGIARTGAPGSTVTGPCYPDVRSPGVR